MLRAIRDLVRWLTVALVMGSLGVVCILLVALLLVLICNLTGVM